MSCIVKEVSMEPSAHNDRGSLGCLHYVEGGMNGRSHGVALLSGILGSGWEERTLDTGVFGRVGVG